MVLVAVVGERTIELNAKEEKEEKKKEVAPVSNKLSMLPLHNFSSPVS